MEAVTANMKKDCYFGMNEDMDYWGEIGVGS